MKHLMRVHHKFTILQKCCSRRYCNFASIDQKEKASKNLLADVCSSTSEALRQIWVNIPMDTNWSRFQEIQIEPIYMIDMCVWLWYEEGNFMGSELLESTLSEAINRLRAGPLRIFISWLNSSIWYPMMRRMIFDDLSCEQ